MARKTHVHTRPQRSRREANREFRRAVQAGSPQSFGIRRRLEREDDMSVRDNFYDLLLDNDQIAQLIEPRSRLHVTIMRRRELDGQLARGIVVGYEFGRAAQRIKSNIAESSSDAMDVTVVEPRIMNHGRAVVLAVQSEQLKDEVRAVMKAMASIGLKGALRKDGFRPHITLGESENPLTRIEKGAILETMSELFVIGESVELRRLEFYPDPNDYSDKSQ